MQLSFRHSNYKATLSQSTNNQNLIDNHNEPNNLLPSHYRILKCVTSKAIIRSSLGADDSNFYEADDEELIVFDGDDEELIFDEDDELTVFDEEITCDEDDEDPARSTILDEENTSPEPVLKIQEERPSDDGDNTPVLTFFWHNPFFNEISRSYFQQCSYWNK